MSNNSSVAHSFAYGQNDKGSNFYSESYGNLLYSYSSLLARRFDNGIILISEPIANYSNTSQRHHSHLIRAINHREYYYVSDLDSYCKLEEILDDKELEVVNNELIELYKKQSRARKRDYSYEIKSQIDKGEAIIKYGKVDKRKLPYKQFLDIKKGVKSINQLIQDSIEAEKKRNKQIAKQRFEANKKRFEKFTGVKCPYKPTELSYNYLRINEDKLQTNGSVSVDLNSARALYRAFKSNKSVVGQKIGYYTILKANDKEVQIGCHHILTKELDRVLGE